jgi:hypothetical protein
MQVPLASGVVVVVSVAEYQLDVAIIPGVAVPVVPCLSMTAWQTNMETEHELQSRRRGSRL